MSYIILAILFLLSGFFMKYSDDLFDVNHDVLLASVYGILCGLVSAFATVSDAGSAYMFMAILIGNLIAFKVDGIHHIITLIVFIIICLICGIPDLSLVILLTCILAALSDEVGHETISKISDNVFLNLFFEYRFVMKIIIFLLGVFGAFDISVFIYFIFFEVAYEIAAIVFENLN
ncbi:hypothetical protein [Methanobrevibacter sp. V74]|uniref:hypothetical protein n=1 Tax=Methanobrevibacter sp. V74 TaxID=3064279 RepID=UPI00273560ED|nr:hypothetical protein [Methanobrevibacter sp. V74]